MRKRERLSDNIEFGFGRRDEAASYHKKTGNIRINLKYVDTPDHLFQLIEHEIIHRLLADQHFSHKKEHRLIHIIQWADYYLPYYEEEE